MSLSTPDRGSKPQSHHGQATPDNDDGRPPLQMPLDSLKARGSPQKGPSPKTETQPPVPSDTDALAGGPGTVLPQDVHLHSFANDQAGDAPDSPTCGVCFSEATSDANKDLTDILEHFPRLTSKETRAITDTCVQWMKDASVKVSSSLPRVSPVPSMIRACVC